MPLEQYGFVSHGSNVDENIEYQILEVFSMLDKKIAELVKTRGLLRSQVKLIQPRHQCVLVEDRDIFVVLAIHDLGGEFTRVFSNASGRQNNMETAISWVETEIGFKDPFGFRFSRSILDYDKNQKESEVARIAAGLIDEEIVNIERQMRIVRLNPIFQGREFLINGRLVFVLSPFEEPFNTIYEDHIRPSVESIKPLRCLRADDIYDNRPIIEDIWQCTNEARLLISELTGRNPNVFYETGIAHTVGKEVILITQSMQDVPFDLKHLRCIVYEYTPRGMTTLEANLKNTILNILARSGPKTP